MTPSQNAGIECSTSAGEHHGAIGAAPAPHRGPRADRDSQPQAHHQRRSRQQDGVRHGFAQHPRDRPPGGEAVSEIAPQHEGLPATARTAPAAARRALARGAHEHDLGIGFRIEEAVGGITRQCVQHAEHQRQQSDQEHRGDPRAVAARTAPSSTLRDEPSGIMPTVAAGGKRCSRRGIHHDGRFQNVDKAFGIDSTERRRDHDETRILEQEQYGCAGRRGAGRRSIPAPVPPYPARAACGSSSCRRCGSSKPT